MTFEQAWATYVAKGYNYGPDALEQVRFGWQIANRFLVELPAGPRRARKIGGSYQANGTVVAQFQTQGRTRYVFEFDEPKGMLHIFGPEQLQIEDPLGVR